jgi:hypothetical protein
MTPLNGAFTIGQGGAQGEIITQPPNGCNLTWTVSGSTATLKASQTCSVPGSLGGTWDATFDSGTLNLNGSVVNVGDQGKAVLAIGGANVQCTFVQSGSFNKS